MRIHARAGLALLVAIGAAVVQAGARAPRRIRSRWIRSGAGTGTPIRAALRSGRHTRRCRTIRSPT